MSNKIWVLTYTIGTNEGRKSRRLICDTKEQAIMQQTVLGGDLVEYLSKPEAFRVNWTEDMDISSALEAPKTWSDFQCLRAEPEVKVDLLTNIREQHAEWSDRQFGDVGPVGPLKHLAKEAIEAAEAPDDISEFADILMLVWDATRRAGFSDEQLAEAVAEKLERNKRRVWGEVKDGEPCHHVKN